MTSIQLAKAHGPQNFQTWWKSKYCTVILHGGTYPFKLPNEYWNSDADLEKCTSTICSSCEDEWRQTVGIFALPTFNSTHLSPTLRRQGQSLQHLSNSISTTSRSVYHTRLHWLPIMLSFQRRLPSLRNALYIHHSLFICITMRRMQEPSPPAPQCTRSRYPYFLSSFTRP